MAQAQATARRTRTAKPTTGATTRRLRLRLLLAGLVAAWILGSHFLLRPLVHRRIEEVFDGTARVGWAIFWPTLDVSAFAVRLEGQHFRAEASHVGVGLRLRGLFDGRLVSSISVAGLEAEVDEGQPLHLFRSRSGDGAPPAGAAASPARLPPLSFREPALVLRREDGTPRPLLQTGALAVEQVGERSFEVAADAGGLAGIPFEKLTARLVPAAGHLLVHDLKVRAFHGMAGGFLDVSGENAGAFNGEMEWHLVEAERIWRALGLPDADKRRGDLSGRMVFRGERPALDAIEGTGTLELRRAAFFSPLSFKVFLTLKIPVAAEARLTSADAGFSFGRSLVYVERAVAHASEFELAAQGLFALDGAVDMEIRHAGTTVAVSGDLADPRIKVLPFDGFTLPFDRIFRERVGR